MELRQSNNWGLFLKFLGWESEYVTVGGVEIAIRIRKLGPLAILKIQRPPVLNEEVFQKIVAVGKSHKAFVTKLEPTEVTPEILKLLKKYRFKLDTWPLLPPKTVVVDLTPTEEEILKRFSKDGRYCLRLSQKQCRDVACNVSTEINGGVLRDFYTLFEATGHRGHFWVPPQREIEAKMEAFGGEALIFLAYKRSELSRAILESPLQENNNDPTVGANHDSPTDPPIAGSLVLIHDQTAYYLHAGSTKDGQKLEAPYLLIWEMIKKAKELGCTKLDLEGIYDERYKKLTKNWQGFTVFKRKFGGEEITYPGAYSRYF